MFSKKVPLRGKDITLERARELLSGHRVRIFHQHQVGDFIHEQVVKQILPPSANAIGSYFLIEDPEGTLTRIWRETQITVLD